MNRKITLPLLFSLLITNNMILIADFWSNVNPINVCKKIKKGIKDYGAGQQALEQVKAQQKILELLANNPRTSACAQQLEQLAAIGKETNSILQTGVDVSKDTFNLATVGIAFYNAFKLGDYGYKFYKWMRPSEEEIRDKKLQNERKKDELEALLTKSATRCLKYINPEMVNSPERVNRCKKVFADYSRFVSADDLADLKKSIANHAP